MAEHVEEEVPMAQDPVPRKVKCAKNLWKPKGWIPSDLAFARPNHVLHRPLVGLVSVPLSPFAKFLCRIRILSFGFDLCRESIS